MDRAASAECGALSLDMLHKFRILVKSNTGFSVAPEYKAKCAYLFGDVKTVDNIDKFVSSLVGRRSSLAQHNETALVFKDTIDQTMCVPDD